MNLEPLWLSLKVALLGTAITVVSGLALIGLATYLQARWRDIIRMLATLPLVLPPTVLGYYLLVLLGRDTFLGGAFKDIFGFDLVFTWQAAVVASAVSSFPLFFMTTMPAFENIDESLINAARVLGKSEWHIFWQVKLPLARLGILSGASLAFSRALGEFGVTLMIAGNIPGKTQTAPLAIYDYVVQGDRAAANWMVSVTTLFGFAFLFFGVWFFQRRHYARGRNDLN